MPAAFRFGVFILRCINVKVKGLLKTFEVLTAVFMKIQVFEGVTT
jgi:hypothetical protein